jgi:hypothetical protein
MNLPASISNSRSAASPIFKGNASSLTVFPGAVLTVNDFGVDMITRKYSMPTLLGPSIRSGLKPGLSDDVYKELRLSTYSISDGVGLMSELSLTFKGRLGWSQEAKTGNGRSLQFVSIRLRDPDHNSSLEVSYYAPTTTRQWNQTTNPTEPPKAMVGVNGALDLTPNKNLIDLFIAVDGTTVQSALLRPDVEAFFLAGVQKLEQTVVVTDFQTNEVVPGQLWECQCTCTKQIGVTQSFIATL